MTNTLFSASKPVSREREREGGVGGSKRERGGKGGEKERGERETDK